MSAEIQIARLRRKITKRDQQIDGLKRRIAALESALALRASDAKVVDAAHLRRDIRAAVTDALCNVRMIPVFGSGRDSKILEVKAVSEGATP